jgi:hypothetical protein
LDVYVRRQTGGMHLTGQVTIVLPVK